LFTNVIEARGEVYLLLFDLDVWQLFVAVYKLEAVDDRFLVEERQLVVVLVRVDVL